MGIMGALGAGIAGAAGAAEKIGLDQIQAIIDEDKQRALLLMREESQKRLTRDAADVQLDTRQREFQQDETNAPIMRARKAEDEKVIGGARAEVQREAKKGEMQDALDFTTTNRKALAANERAIAMARHIVDPNITLTPLGDGTIMRYDTRSGKALGVLTDPTTGKPLAGKKDLSESQLALAKSYFTEGEQMMKDALDPEAKAKGAARMEAGRKILMGDDGGKGGQGEIRYDGQGNAYRRGPDGKPVRIDAGGAGKPSEPQAKTGDKKPEAGPAAAAALPADAGSGIVKMDRAGSGLMGGKQFIATYADGTKKVVSGEEAERQYILMQK